ncbi:MAG: hypothetical protein V1731_00735 [Candidatus Aenigmatarchaeota archaeon]
MVRIIETAPSARVSPIKPVYLMRTPDVTIEEKNVARGALEEVLDIAGVGNRVHVIDFDVWREPNYTNPDGELVPHKSVDWYVTKWKNRQRGQVNIHDGATQLLFDPWVEKNPHYDVIITAEDLYIPDTNFVVGVAHPTRGTIISVRRFRSVPDRLMQRETIKEETYHEIGHVFDLPKEGRGFAINYSLGSHCTNTCAMRQGLYVPHDWVGFVNDRLRTGRTYCEPCAQDLRNYFSK